jgi:RNA polymerase sigma-70 factor (ECF subfamily)
MKMAPASDEFSALIEQHKGVLYKVARAYCPVAEERDDLMQEILVRLWRAWPSYDARFALTTWLYRVALNTAISYYRQHALRRASRVPLDKAALQVQEPADTSEQEQRLALLLQFIGELNELDKALMLLYLEDKSHAVIAEILGLSVSNVATKVGRIKERLKQRFSRSGFYAHGKR